MKQRVAFRIVAIALAMMWLVLPVMLDAHRVLEQHRYCAEHERIEHTRAARTFDIVATPGSTREACSVDRDAPASIEHEVCELGAALTTLSTSIAPQSTTLPASACAPAAAFVQRDVAIAVAILAVAPKGSPPTRV